METLSQDAHGLNLGKMVSFIIVRVSTPSLEPPPGTQNS